MFYEESVIDGVLHWRGVPGGSWNQFTLDGLTAKFLSLKSMHEALIATRATESAEMSILRTQLQSCQRMERPG